MTEETRAVWTTAYVNDLPDSAFLYIEGGGSKDSDGKTTPRSLRHFPVKDASGNVDLPHLRNALARIPQSSLPADVKAAATKKAQAMLQNANGRSSREEFRALPRGPELRDDGAPLPTLVGTLAVFDEWTEIRSRSEGHFLERIAPGAFSKTISENRDRMRVLFQHGKDPQIGDKPLGPIARLEPDDREVHYEVPLLNTSYNRDIAEMLTADPPVLGSSFRFEVLRDDYKRRPGKSAHNPRGLDERTVQEVRMSEFGPVTFPAYTGAKAGLRSLTDRMLLGRDELRADTEDLSTLAQMIQLASCYIDEQDEPGDEQNIPVMQNVLKQLTGLMPYELQEDEGDEPEDEENSETPAGRTYAPSKHAAALVGTASGSAATTPLFGHKEAKPSWLL